MRIHLPIRPLLAILCLSSFLLCLGLNQVSMAQTPTVTQLVQQGVDCYQKGDYKTAVDRWKTALESYPNDPANAVIIQENLARAQQQLGKSNAAIEQWEKVTAYYRQTKDLESLGHSLTEQAQVYSSLGQSRKAIALLCGEDKKQLQAINELACLPESALQIARAANDKKGEAAALGSLGDAQRLLGDYQSAIVLLKASLALAPDVPAYSIAALNSLGNAHSSLAQVNYRRAESANQRGDSQEEGRFTTISKGYDEIALKHFNQGLEQARSQTDAAGELRSLISAIPVYYRIDTSAATQTHQQATAVLARVPDSQQRVYAAIDLARLLQPITIKETSARSDCLAAALLTQAETLLKDAADTAQRLNDQRAASFALGAQGHLQECRNDTLQALQLTNQARLTADQAKAKDSLYLWEWQAGRILRNQGRNEAAIAAYQRASTTLEAIRDDILSANRDLQFDFRDTIEPIYRQLIALRLEQEQSIQTKAIPTKAEEFKSEENYKGIVGAIDSLRLAELQNYFGNDCVITAAAPSGSDAVRDPFAAIINTFVLEDQTAIIFSLPDEQKRFALHPIPRQKLIDQINLFREGLESYENDLRGYDPKPAQEIYDWLIRPFANDLEQAHIKTLVFVQDGILRSVPMAALHDGKQFLIQKYAIATIPSLKTTSTKAFNRNGLRVLALGLTKQAIINNQRLPLLTNVRKEVKGITGKFSGSKELLDDGFTYDGMKKELSQTVYPIIHFATHGHFGTDPEDTFIVTGNIEKGNNQKLKLNELDSLIRGTLLNREPLELLTLTACETAVGDDRSSLGLAGVAVQAGARSALASLWSIDDAATAEVATNFYAKLSDTRFNKAQALQAAQKSLIEQASIADQRLTHPAYWAPFILIGNWQ